MEILRAKVEVSSSSKLPPRGETQFVMMKSLEPGLISITLQTEDPAVTRKLRDKKRVTIILEDEEFGGEH